MLRRALASPARWWGRSLSLRVVSSSVVATLVVLAATGWFLIDSSARGIIEAKTRHSVSEAGAVLATMQASLRDTDLRTASVNERLTQLAGEAASRGSVGNQYGVVITGPVSDITSAGVDVESVPEVIRREVRQGGTDLYTTPTLVAFTDGRPSHAGLVVGGTLLAPGSGRYPVYFLFALDKEETTLALIQRSALTAAIALLPVLAGVMYLISLQVLRPVRAARKAAERMAAGHLDERMGVTGADDLAGLGRSMNHMGDELGRKIQELEDLSRVQRQFVSDVSHELRTPLTTVRMAADLLYDARGEFPPLAERSAVILARELDRFESLLTELLEISRFDAGAAVLQPEEVDLARLVAVEVDAHQALAEKYRTAVTIDASGDDTILADPRRVRRIVSNLLSNAIEHGEERPIEVFVRANEDAVAVAVRDHGVGFDAAQAHQVFTRFWRADPARARTVGGSGLGLSIALEDAQLHGGWLNAWGRPGHGAQFRLTLPREPGAAFDASPWPVVPPDEVRR